MVKSNSPLRYIGGKAYMLDYIIPIIPKHELFVEVFGGAGHVSLSKPRSPFNIFNDKNSDLINLFLTMRDNGETLKEKLSNTPYSRAIFQEYKYAYKNEAIWESATSFDRALMYFYILCNSVNSNFSSFSTSIGTKPKPEEYQNRLEKIKNVYKHFTIENLDFKECIEKYDSENTFFYLDPPYVDCEHYYQTGFNEKDHRDLSEMLKHIKGKFLLSYYPHALVSELYKGFDIVEKEFTKHSQYQPGQLTRDKSIELFISNYPQIAKIETNVGTLFD
jgi:DNA adenine methylase